MTRRLVLGLAVAMLVIMAVTVTVTIAESRRMPEWRTLLATYTAVNQAKIVQAKRASKPWTFDDEVEHSVVNARSFQYSADITYDGPTIDTLMIPYPPQVVYCVLLQKRQTQTIVFVNYYSDTLWQYGWVLHSTPTVVGTHEMDHALASLGCQLTRDIVNT
ncbi:MAG: hypothetical protein AAF702_44850 [Chloroflexota bacterium]